MGTPFAGFVRDPNSEPTPSPEQLSNAINTASITTGVPAKLLSYVNQRETGGQLNAAQVVGFNSSGYGGLFGLPKDMLGGVEDQAKSAANILRTQFEATGSWEGALRKYSGGAYGLPGTDGPKATPNPGSGFVPKLPLPNLPDTSPGRPHLGEAGGPSLPGININVPGFEQVGTFFGNLGGLFNPANWWRAAFLATGVVAIVAGARMYMSGGGEPVAEPA